MQPPRKPEPITAGRVENALDILAWVMSKSRNANRMVPLWKRLEGELARLREEEEIVAVARARAAAIQAAREVSSAG